LSNVVHMHRPAGATIRVIRKSPPPPKATPGRHAPSERVPRPESGTGSETPLEPYRIPIDDAVTEERLEKEYERGRLQGLAEAAAAISERDAVVQKEVGERMQGLFDAIARETARFTGDLERDAYRFAIAVAERIVKREITLDDAVVMRQMREAVRRIVGVEVITVRVHPDDETLLRSHRAALLTSSDSVREILIEGDETIERGGCILESATGNVDARIGSQLRQIETALFGSQLPIEEEAG
jgi:flagellar assembly protein FliH